MESEVTIFLQSAVAFVALLKLGVYDTLLETNTMGLGTTGLVVGEK